MEKVLHRQGWHLLAWVAGGAMQWWMLTWFPESTRIVWGLSVTHWVAVSWVFCAMFQGGVALLWRLELHRATLSRHLGAHAFRIHRIAFIVPGTGRFLPFLPLSQGSAETLPWPRGISVALIVGSTPLILWVFFSLVAYFGINRAFGADHFDPAYGSRGLERRGVFRFVPNAMYTLGFLLFYHPALFWQSGLGLAVAAAHHALVWTHYFCTEKPDLALIYGRPGDGVPR